ncbi:MAG: hypothetical protein QM767_22235 [Anaeromyxobacter sp.]
MFSNLNKQGVRSDLGFEVQITGRFSAEYREGGRVFEIPVEFGGGMGGACVILRRAEIVQVLAVSRKWNLQEEARILTNLEDAFRFLGLDVSIE